MKEVLGVKLYTVKEVAEHLGVSPRSTQQYVLDKKMKAVKIGRSWFISEDNLKEFMNGAENFETMR